MPLKYFIHISLVLLFCFTKLAEAAVIEGVVVTERGPLDGASVKAYLSLPDAISDKNAIHSISTKKPGGFRLEISAGRYYLTASGHEEERKFFSFHGANPVNVEEKQIWLPFVATPVVENLVNKSANPKISGFVTYKGKTVSDAQVSLYPVSEKNIRGLGLQTKSSDKNGGFNLAVNPGSYIIVARKRNSGRGKMPLKKGDLFCFSGPNPLTVEDAREIVIDVPCAPKDDLDGFLAKDIKVKRSHVELSRFRENLPKKTNIGITGTVVDNKGKPVKNMQVTAYLHDPAKTFQMHYLRLASEQVVQTDAGGKYFIPLAKGGAYYVVARQYGGESPLKGELYGLYEGNADQTVTVIQGVMNADITVGRIMEEVLQNEPSPGNTSVSATVLKAPAIIERDTVWSGEVLVEGTVLVARNATLNIMPGTTIRFKRIDRDGDGIGDGEIRVTGRIVAKGTSEKPIRFISGEDKPRPGDWSYLLLFTSGYENDIEHAVIEDAFTGIQIHFSRAVIRDSFLRNNSEGIRFGRAELDIEHNEIADNDIGIRYHRLEGPVKIHRNTIKGNGVGLFLVPSPQKFVDSSAERYIPDARYYIPPFISDNSITDNLRYNYQLGERLLTDIPVSENWWGTTDMARIQTTVFDKRRDPELGRVTILPILSAPLQGVGPRR